jgi:cell division protein FtsB
VHGAWTTPAVVVRRPDGSVVTGGDGDDVPEELSDDVEAAGSVPAGATRPARRPRIRPRRIPGAPGAVLLRTTLSDAVGASATAPQRRRSAAASTPLPPRSRADGDGSKPARPSLRAVGGTSRPSSGAGKDGTGVPIRRGRSGGRGRRGPSPSRPGERRQQRVLQALAGLNFDRLLPADEEARERRSARLRRLATRLATVATVVLVVYGVFPVRTWIDQEAASDRARERREVFERENDLLAEEVRDLGREERIEEEARAMGMVLPGEESYGITPPRETSDAEGTPASTTSTTEPAEPTG